LATGVIDHDLAATGGVIRPARRSIRARGTRPGGQPETAEVATVCSDPCFRHGYATRDHWISPVALTAGRRATSGDSKTPDVTPWEEPAVGLEAEMYGLPPAVQCRLRVLAERADPAGLAGVLR
jgi:hypothetical protein